MRLLQPQDFQYLGAFRLPEGSAGSSWEYSGSALAHNPSGDPQGPDDGFSGSLFGTGHDVGQQISEISIPVPVISTSGDLRELNTAATLQSFHDIRGEVGVSSDDLELERAGLAWLPPRGSQVTGKLYFSWGQHYQDEYVESLGWCETDLSQPKTAGGWFLGGASNYSVGDYLFEIPLPWADAHAGGRALAAGRFRDGGWSGQGPSLYAVAPWQLGDPPPAGTSLETTRLLQYTASDDGGEENHVMDGYHHSDEWSGGAWVSTDSGSAVLFTGTKGEGDCWYGFSNGVVWPEEPPYPEIPAPPHDDRGWWSDGFTGVIVFYDPEELAAVASGLLEPWEPQPYATLDIDGYMYGVSSPQQKSHVGAAAFDSGSSILYLLEPMADGDKSIVHAWKVGE